MDNALGDHLTAASRWRVWFLMANQDIDMRYRRSVLGPFWISLSLAVMVLTLAVLYSQIFNHPFREYLTYLASGLLAWNFIVAFMTEGSQSVMENDGPVRSLPFPSSLGAARVVWRNGVIFWHNAAVILIMLCVMGKPPQVISLLAIVGFLSLATIGYFTGCVLGPISARFRDIQQVIANIMQAAFFLTPIIWQPSQLGQRPGIVEINPFHHMIEVVRAPMLSENPSPTSWAVVACLILGSMLMSVISLSLTRKKVFLWV